MTKIEKDLHLLISIAVSLRGFATEALIHVDNPTKAGLRKVRDARDNINTLKFMIEDRIEAMAQHIAENESRLNKGKQG